MGKKFLSIGVSALFLFASLGLVAAQEKPAQAPAKPQPCSAKPAVAKLKRASGTLKSASADSLVIEVTGTDKSKKDWTFALDKSSRLSKGGKSVTAKDVAAGDSARVSYEEKDGKMTAKSVTLTAPAKKEASKEAAPPAKN
jgi:hypothetical protein